jgi:hypothetical protein
VNWQIKRSDIVDDPEEENKDGKIAENPERGGRILR